MRCPVRLYGHLVAVLCGVVVVCALRPLAPPLLSAADDGDPETCVRPIADITGDGIPDLAVTRTDARSGAVTAALIAGPHDPTTIVQDTAYRQQQHIAALHGPAAMPFLCVPAWTASRDVAATADRRGPSVPPSADLTTPAYRVVDLSLLAPAGREYGLIGARLNAAGRLVGQFTTADGQDHAFVYDGITLQDLGTLGGHQSMARGINRHGTIVGHSLTGATDRWGWVHAAFLFDRAPMQQAARDWSVAADINDAGQIVGSMQLMPDEDVSHAHRWDQGVATDLGTLPPFATTAYSAAYAINEAGWIVGESNTYTHGVQYPDRRYQAVRAFFWADGVMQDLGSFGVQCGPFTTPTSERCYERSVATDLNASGTVVGFSSSPTNGRGHAFLANGDALQDLGALGGNASFAYGINDSGQVVGGFANTEDRLGPFLYDRGVMYDLNEIAVDPSPDMVRPYMAYDINNFGQILANAHLLQPVYDSVAPGTDFQVAAPRLRRTVTLAYWVKRGAAGECRIRRSRLHLEVKADAPGRPTDWTPAAVVRTCDDSTDWETVSIPIPRRAQGLRGAVSVRVRETGPRTEPVVYLRHIRVD
jgi:probable HAF family extracellular repeat protein